MRIRRRDDRKILQRARMMRQKLIFQSSWSSSSPSYILQCFALLFGYCFLSWLHESTSAVELRLLSCSVTNVHQGEIPVISGTVSKCRIMQYQEHHHHDSGCCAEYPSTTPQSSLEASASSPSPSTALWPNEFSSIAAPQITPPLPQPSSPVSPTAGTFQSSNTVDGTMPEVLMVMDSGDAEGAKMDLHSSSTSSAHFWLQVLSSSFLGVLISTAVATFRMEASLTAFAAGCFWGIVVMVLLLVALSAWNGGSPWLLSCLLLYLVASAIVLDQLCSHICLRQITPTCGSPSDNDLTCHRAKRHAVIDAATTCIILTLYLLYQSFTDESQSNLPVWISGALVVAHRWLATHITAQNLAYFAKMRSQLSHQFLLSFLPKDLTVHAGPLSCSVTPPTTEVPDALNKSNLIDWSSHFIFGFHGRAITKSVRFVETSNESDLTTVEHEYNNCGLGNDEKYLTIDRRTVVSLLGRLISLSISISTTARLIRIISTG